MGGGGGAGGGGWWGGGGGDGVVVGRWGWWWGGGGGGGGGVGVGDGDHPRYIAQPLLLDIGINTLMTSCNVNYFMPHVLRIPCKEIQDVIGMKLYSDCEDLPIFEGVCWLA